MDTTDRSYGGIVSAIINDRYSQDRVQAILANYQNAIDPESTIDVDKRAEYLQEYHEFQDYREHAKTVARLAVAKIEE